MLYAEKKKKAHNLPTLRKIYIINHHRHRLASYGDTRPFPQAARPAPTPEQQHRAHRHGREGALVARQSVAQHLPRGRVFGPALAGADVGPGVGAGLVHGAVDGAPGGGADGGDGEDDAPVGAEVADAPDDADDDGDEGEAAAVADAEEGGHEGEEGWGALDQARGEKDLAEEGEGGEGEEEDDAGDGGGFSSCGGVGGCR